MFECTREAIEEGAMCLSNVYVDRGEEQELVAEDVALIRWEDGEMVMEDLFGEQHRIAAAIQEIDLVRHRVLLKENVSGELPEPLKRARAFHGHLGPMVAIGLRMGRIIVGRLGDTPFSFHIRCFTGKTPPLSCVMDGLQLSTPCTVGNGGIEIVEDGEVRATASDKAGRTVEVRLRSEISELIKAQYDPNHEEALPLALWEMSEEALFEVREG
ncbi:MAG: CooT family nickel-binding protein [Candidatus Latescibacterota bacterium]